MNQVYQRVNKTCNNAKLRVVPSSEMLPDIENLKLERKGR